MNRRGFFASLAALVVAPSVPVRAKLAYRVDPEFIATARRLAESQAWLRTMMRDRARWRATIRDLAQWRDHTADSPTRSAHGDGIY